MEEAVVVVVAGGVGAGVQEGVGEDLVVGVVGR
jgi:hypothetical protein